MADNVAVTEGSGKNIATDDIQVDGSHTQGQVQFVKLVDGALNGTASVRVDIGAKANALRVAPANDITDGTYIGDIRFGESLPAGTNEIGKLAANSGVDIGDVTLNAGTATFGKLAANSGVDIGDVDITSIIPLTGAINLGKARDAALGANDVGVMALAVRDDTLTTLTPADGDFVPLRVSSTGQLHVTGGGGGTQYNIDTILGGAATTTLAGVVRNDSLTTLTEADGDISVLRVSSTGQLHVTGGGGGTEYTEDTITANPQVGSAIMMERDDALTTVTPVEADWIGLRGTAEGALWVQDFNSDAILADTANMDINLGTIAGAVAAGQMQVDVVAPLPAGTNNIGDVDILSIAAGDNNIGNVDIETLPSDTFVVEAGVLGKGVLLQGDDGTDRKNVNVDATSGNLQVDVVNTITETNSGAIKTAVELLDNAIDGNYLNVNANIAGTDFLGGAGAVAGGVQRITLASDDPAVAKLGTIDTDTGNIATAVEIMDDWDATHASASSPDGPQIMGAAYSAALPTDVGADADAARICTDRFGRILAGLMPQNFQATFTSADAQAAVPVKVKTVSRKMYILSLVVSVDTAMSVQFQDDTGPTILIEQLYLAANGGAHLTWPPEAPLVVDTNEDFDVTTSASGNISVTITGYLAI